MPTSSDDARVDPVLVFDALVAGYGGPPVINGVTAQVGPGEIVTVVGPNGAGKSTLIKAIAGIVAISAGQVTLAGKQCANVPTNQLARMGLGYVPQTADVFPNLTVRENLEMGGYQLRRRETAGRLEEVIDVLPSLRKLIDRRAEKLSGGERKMAGIGRALMSQPSVLLLDEPTAGLSPELSRIFLEEHIRKLASAGTAILLVEQKALAALEISDWGLLLVNGATYLGCAARELLDRPDIGELFLGRGSHGSAAHVVG